MRKALSSLFALCFAATLAVPVVEATTLRAVSIRELATRAERIVIGRCSVTRAEWIGRRLVTLATFEVDETLKGDPAASVTVAIPGGIDAAHRPPLQMIYAGAPQVFVGGEALLFLRPSAALGGVHTLVGFAQGLIALHPGPAGRVGRRDLGGLTLVDAAHGTARGAAESFELAALKREIAAALAEPRAEVAR